MPAGAIIGGITAIGSIASGILGQKAAKKQARTATEAAAAQEQGILAGIEEQRRQFDIAQEFGAPRREAEEAALTSLRGLLGLGGEAPSFEAFEQAPGFQFTREEALQATERGAAARGGLVSGGTLAELQNRAAGLAGQNFLQSFLQPTLQLATGGAGQFAGQQAIGLGQRVGGGLERAGAARASGILGVGQAQQQGLTNLNQAIQGGLGNLVTFNQLGGFGQGSIFGAPGGGGGFNPGFGQPNQGFPTTFPGVG